MGIVVPRLKLRAEMYQSFLLHILVLQFKNYILLWQVDNFKARFDDIFYFHSKM